MSTFLDTVGQFILNHYAWRHFIVALALIIHGEAAVILAVYLILKSYLGWGGFLVSVILSFLVYETFFYALGRFLKDTRFAGWVDKKIPEETRKHIERHLHEKATLFLIASKFVIYFNVVVLFLSGWIKLDFKKFFVHRLIAHGIWFVATTVVAYSIFSGVSFLKFENSNFEIGAIILILFAIFSAKHILKKLIIKEGAIEKAAERLCQQK